MFSGFVVELSFGRPGGSLRPRTLSDFEFNPAGPQIVQGGNRRFNLLTSSEDDRPGNPFILKPPRDLDDPLISAFRKDDRKISFSDLFGKDLKNFHSFSRIDRRRQPVTALTFFPVQLP